MMKLFLIIIIIILFWFDFYDCESLAAVMFEFWVVTLSALFLVSVEEDIIGAATPPAVAATEMSVKSGLKWAGLWSKLGMVTEHFS